MSENFRRKHLRSLGPFGILPLVNGCRSTLSGFFFELIVRILPKYSLRKDELRLPGYLPLSKTKSFQIFTLLVLTTHILFANISSYKGCKISTGTPLSFHNIRLILPLILQPRRNRNKLIVLSHLYKLTTIYLTYGIKQYIHANYRYGCMENWPSSQIECFLATRQVGQRQNLPGGQNFPGKPLKNIRISIYALFYLPICLFPEKRVPYICIALQ